MRVSHVLFLLFILVFTISSLDLLIIRKTKIIETLEAPSKYNIGFYVKSKCLPFPLAQVYKQEGENFGQP
jgi:hypothetical protein